MTKEEQIVHCENRLLDAMRNGDITILDELIHDSLVFNIPSGQTISKQMDIENYRSGMLKIHSISVSDRAINIIDNLSTVAVTVYLKGKYSDQKIDGKFRYLRVWIQHNNSWKIIAGSGVQI